MPGDQLIIFVKAPRVGTVKTRLAQSIGAEAARDAYCALTERALRNLESLASVQLRFAPDDGAGDIRPWLKPGWTMAAQGPGDLGDRMHRAFVEHLAVGAGRVVLIGSDCPDVTASDIATAWTQLQSHDVVLGPATDGGYWLVGLRQPQPDLFNAMPWSTDTVLSETLRRAKEQGLSVHLLRELTDVDTDKEWKAWLLAQKRS